MHRRTLRATACVAAASAVALSCYAPTEIVVSLSTDLSCVVAVDAGGASDGGARTIRPPITAVYLGADLGTAEPLTETRACNASAAPGEPNIGSLVLVPSGERDARVTVHVVTTADGREPASCRDAYARAAASGTPELAGCIVARRTLRFRPHRSSPYPIRMDSRCLGVRCPEAETCVDGICAPSDVDAPGFRDECVGCVADAGVDARVPEDAGADVDAALPACDGIGGGVVVDGIGATDLIAVNGTDVYWAVASAAGGTTEVYRVPKTGAATPPATPLVATLGTPLGLYASETGGLLVTTQAVVSFSSTNTLSTATGRQLRAAAFADDTAWVVENTVPGAVFRYAKAATGLVSTPAGVTAPANARLAATWNRVYVTEPAIDTIGKYEIGTGLVRIGEFNPVPQPKAIAAYDDPAKTVDPAGFVLYTSANGPALLRLEPAPFDATSAVLGDTPGATALAVDATAVYHLDTGSALKERNVFRTPRVASSGPGAPRVPLSATGFKSVGGLAVDDRCVYVSAVDLTGTIVRLRALRKDAP